jgi:hypothetical protein
MTKAQINKVINKLKKEHPEAFKEDGVDLFELCLALGFQVVNAQMNTDDDGFLIVAPERTEIFGMQVNKMIGYNRKYQENEEKKRFLIAYELGHYVLYYETENENGEYAHMNHGETEAQDKDVCRFIECLFAENKNTENTENTKNKENEENMENDAELSYIAIRSDKMVVMS